MTRVQHTATVNVCKLSLTRTHIICSTTPSIPSEMFSKSLTCLNSDHVHDYHRVRSILYTGKIQKTVRKFELPHLIFQSTHKTASQLHRLKPLCSYFSDHAVLELGLAFFSFAWFLNNNRELHFTIFSLNYVLCAMFDQFSEPYFTVRPAKFRGLFELKYFPSI